jgi:hypothetical protein
VESPEDVGQMDHDGGCGLRFGLGIRVRWRQEFLSTSCDANAGNRHGYGDVGNLAANHDDRTDAELIPGIS